MIRAIKSQSIWKASVSKLRLSAKYPYNISINNTTKVAKINFNIYFDYGFYFDTFMKSSTSSNIVIPLYKNNY